MCVLIPRIVPPMAKQSCRRRRSSDNMFIVDSYAYIKKIDKDRNKMAFQCFMLTFGIRFGFSTSHRP